MVNRKFVTLLLAAVLLAAAPKSVNAEPRGSVAGAETAWGIEEDLEYPEVSYSEMSSIIFGQDFPVENEWAEEPLYTEALTEADIPSEAEQPSEPDLAGAASPDAFEVTLYDAAGPENAEADGEEGLIGEEGNASKDGDIEGEPSGEDELPVGEEDAEGSEDAGEEEILDVPTANAYAFTFGNSSTSTKNTKKYTRIPVTRYAGKDYSLVFDARYYLQHNPDVAALVSNDYELALRHFVLYGMDQRRQAIASFNVLAYYNNYPELREEFGTDWSKYYRHYQVVGKSEGYVGTGTVKSKAAAKAAQEAARKAAEEAAAAQAAQEAQASQAAAAQAAAETQQLFQTQQATAATLTASNVRATAFLQEVAKVAEYARVRGMRYGNSSSAIPCEDGYISCDRLIARALYNLGFRDQPIGGIANFSICNYLEAHGFRKGTSFSDIEAGSIVVVINNAGSFHCFVAASYDPATNVFVKYDEGSNARIRSQQPFVEPWAYSRLVAVYNFT